MKRFSAFVAVTAALFVAVAIAAAGFVAVTTTPAEAGPCICPKIYAPVECDNGKTYPNLCVAQCHHATGCELIPGGGV